MRSAKPRIFIGSSGEAKPFVTKLSRSMNSFCRAEPWFESPIFRSTESTLADLLRASMFYDFCVLILTPDDLTISRKAKSRSVRDNVLFEFGLFLGALGTDRVIGLMQHESGKGKALKIPSDLFGINLPRFSFKAPTAARSAVNQVLPEIKRKVEERGLRHGFLSIRDSWSFDRRSGEFILETDPVKVHQFKPVLEDQGLMLVIRKQDRSIARDLDTAIAAGRIRHVSKRDSGVMIVKTSAGRVLGKLKPGDIVEAYLLLVPKGKKPEKKETLNEMFALGCRVIDAVGQTVDS